MGCGEGEVARPRPDGAHLRDVPRKCLGSVSEVPRKCLGNVSEVPRKCLESASEVPQKCLVNVSEMPSDACEWRGPHLARTPDQAGAAAAPREQRQPGHIPEKSGMNGVAGRTGAEIWPRYSSRDLAEIEPRLSRDLAGARTATTARRPPGRAGRTAAPAPPSLRAEYTPTSWRDCGMAQSLQSTA